MCWRFFTLTNNNNNEYNKYNDTFYAHKIILQAKKNK